MKKMLRNTFAAALGACAAFHAEPSQAALQTVVEFIHYTGTHGYYPEGRLVSDGAGYLWGTTTSGVAGGYGTIFTIDVSSGELTTVVQFSGSNGAFPMAGLASDGAGYFWGTTAHGGATSNRGTVFKISAGTGELTMVAEFTGGNGGEPEAELASDGAGYLWGTTHYGGASEYGTVFKIDISTGELTTVVEFDDATNAGAYPHAALACDGAGYLWGTTGGGGSGGVGTVFKIDPSSGTLTTVAEFTGIKGAFPDAALVSDGAGYLWGTTMRGCVDNFGTVFKVNANTGALTMVAEFTGWGGTNRGIYPMAALVSDGAGYLWGTTYSGGSGGGGTVFKISMSPSPVVALKGDSASGISGYPAFLSFGSPATNNAGNVAFRAAMKGTGVSGANSLGIWADDSTGTRLLVVRGGSPAPDAGGSPMSAAFKKFSDPIYSGSHAVGFLGMLATGTDGVNASNDTGIWSNGSGTLQLAAREGSQAPGCPSGVVFSHFKEFSLTDENGVVLLARVAGTGVTTANDMGVWVGSGSAQQLVLREGCAIPGTSGTVKTFTFLAAPSRAKGQTRCFDSAGDLLYGVKFATGTTAIYQMTIDSGTYTHTAVATQGDPATGISGATFASFGKPTMNDRACVAFGARLAGSTITSSNSLGIWADDVTGTRQLVVRGGTSAPGTGGAAFTKFSDPVYSGNCEVAFLGALAMSGTTTAANDTGVWSNDGGTLHLVAREGEQAPGCASGVVFKIFKQIALPDQGGVVMLANLGGTGVSSTNSMGIWAVDAGGGLQLIARTGDVHTVTGQTIKGLSFLPSIGGLRGQTRSFSQATGDLVYSATFTDGSSGIFKAVFP